MTKLKKGELLDSKARLKNDLENVYRIYANLMGIFGDLLDEVGYTQWDKDVAPTLEKLEEAMQKLYEQLN